MQSACNPKPLSMQSACTQKPPACNQHAIRRCGRPLWKAAVEGRCGRPLWKSLWKAVEGRCGRPLWKAVKGCGRLWKAVEWKARLPAAKVDGQMPRLLEGQAASARREHLPA